MSPMTFDSKFFDIAPGTTALKLRLGDPSSVTFDDASGDFDPAVDAAAYVLARWL